MATEKSALNHAQAEALRLTLLTGLGAAGTGGLLAFMSNQTRSRKPLADLATQSPQMVSIPFPKAKPEATRIDNELEEDETEKMAKDTSWAGYFTGANAHEPLQIPLLWPAAMGVGLGAGALGYKTISDMLKNRRKQQMAQEVQDAEEEFNQALLGSYDQKKLDTHKAAMAREVSEGLNKLASLLNIGEEKKANLLQDASTNLHALVSKAVGLDPDDISRNSGYVTGPLMLGAAAIPAASAYLAYKYYKSRDKAKLLNDAAKARQIARLNENVPEPYVQVES